MKTKNKTNLPRGQWRLAPSANNVCWSAQEAMEVQLTAAIGERGWQVVRAHEIDKSKGRGFIDCQRMGIKVFRQIPKIAPVVAAESVWEYSHISCPAIRRTAVRS